MPCYDHRDHDTDCSYAREDERQKCRHNSDVAELLCALMKKIECTGYFIMTQAK